MERVLDVCAKELVDYVLECLSCFNRGSEVCLPRAFGENISRALKVAFILSRYFSIDVSPPRFSSLRVNGIESPCLTIPLMLGYTLPQGEAFEPEGIVEFPVYHLLLDLLLLKRQGFEIYINRKSNKCHLLNIELDRETGYFIRYDGEREPTLLNSLVSALYRCGYVLSPFWKDVAMEISQYDDVILGVDTNILLGATLTEHLFVHLSLTDVKEFVSTPNWLLVVIPNAVMHELEQGANLREGALLTDNGRRSYRGLQEILDIDRREDLVGVSLLIVGESNPILDTRVELRRLRELLSKEMWMLAKVMSEEGITARSKPSSGDMVIRDQFKYFLRQIDFHKGVYFLTSDKSNAALARAEGLHSIYYKLPPWYYLKVEEPMKPPAIPCEGAAETIQLMVPLGKLIYELAVEFGFLRIPTDFGEIQIECDRKGELLDHWVFKDLRFVQGLKRLLSFYQKEGRFPLGYVQDIWHRFVEREE